MQAPKKQVDKPKQQQPKSQQSPKQKPAQDSKAKVASGLDTRFKTTTLFKSIYDTPFRISWPATEKKDWDEVSQKLASISKLGAQRHQKSVPEKARKRKAEEITEEADDATEQPIASRKPSIISGNAEELHTTHESAAARSTPEEEVLLVGLNEVTKKLERDEVRLVVVAKNMEPARILQHLPPLCALRKVPLCPLPVDSINLGQFFGLNSVICFAFKKSQEQTKLEDLISFISAKSPPLNIPWLSDNIRQVANQNLAMFKQAAAASEKAAEESEATDPNQFKLEHKNLQPLQMKRAEFKKAIPITGKGKTQKHAKARKRS